MSTTPVFVPIALPLDEAMSALNACRVVFVQLTAMGRTGEVPELARAMYGIAKAIDERTKLVAASSTHGDQA